MVATAPGLNTGAKSYDLTKYEILIDESTATAFEGGPVAWLNGQEWRATGVDPSLFPQGVIPMKRILLENGVNNHSLATKYYALAHRSDRVEGPPRLLISIAFRPGDLVKCLFDGSVQISPETNTLAFKKQITPQNYPGITAVARRIVPEISSRLLQSGYTALSNKRSRTSE